MPYGHTVDSFSMLNTKFYRIFHRKSSLAELSIDSGRPGFITIKIESII